MTRLALERKNHCSVSSIEIRRSGVSYTVDTVRKIRSRYPNGTILLIIGSDNLRHFHTWKAHEEILKMATLAVYGRSKRAMKLFRHIPKSGVRVIRGSLIDLSSSGIRRIVRQGGSITSLVPEHVERYIRSRHLYRS
jgi:nicotinate-nucleotide adenylyltransferase